MRSSPAKRTLPRALTPCGRRRAIARAVSDLPEPDSPTMPMVSAGPTADRDRFALVAAHRRDREAANVEQRSVVRGQVEVRRAGVGHQPEKRS
jgi:hypothetical protein